MKNKTSKQIVRDYLIGIVLICGLVWGESLRSEETFTETTAEYAALLEVSGS